MSTYSLIAADLLTGRVITELPFAELEYNNAINTAGELGVSIRLDGLDESVVQSITSATVPARSCVYVERGGVLVWGGPIWGRRYSNTDRVLRLDGAEFLSYFDKCFLTDTLAFPASCDYSQVARALVQYAQDKATNADLDIVAAAPLFKTNGKTTNQGPTYYYGDEGTSVLKHLQDLAGLDNGPDLRVHVRYDGTSIVRELHVGNDFNSNRAGTTFAVSSNVLQVGVDADGLDVTEDGWAVGNVSYQIGTPPEGSPDGTRAPVASYAVSNAWVEGWPRLEQVEARNDVSDSTQLAAFATSAATAYALPTIALTTKVTIRESNFSTYDVGDEVRIDVEESQDPRWPNGLSVYGRIASRKVQVSGGKETVEATVVTEGVTV